jgi:DNA sulfur modification protein DndD
MFIKEVELNNFRIYKGVNKISILPSDEKNIIVISGKNGFGKTTFLMALVWCLYGKQMEKVDDLYEKEIRDKGNYTKYIAESLNRDAADKGVTQFSVSITFTDIVIPDMTKCDEIKITRTYDVVSSASDKIEVQIDGRHNEIIDDLTKDNQKGEEIFIREFILPIEIAKFFLFDAEKIVSLAEVNSNVQRKQLSKAYSEVLGIQKYEDLKANLEEKLDDYRKKTAKKEEKEELNTLRTQIDNAVLEIEAFEQEIDDLKHEKNFLHKEVEDIQRKLIREGEKMTVDELMELKIDQSKLEEEKTKIQEKLRDLFDLIPFGLAGEIVMNTSEHLQKEKQINDFQYRQDDLEDKTLKILNSIEKERIGKLGASVDVSIRDFYEAQIKIAIKKYFYSDLPEITSEFKPLHDFSNIEINEFNQLVNTLKSSFKESFNRLNNEYSYTKNQLESINRKIRDAEKSAEDEYIGELRRTKTKNEDRISEIDKEIAEFNREIGNKNNEIKTAKQKQEGLRKKIDQSSQYSAKAQKTKELINKLQEFIAKFKIQKKESLEQKMLSGLNILLHKKGFISRVEVDINSSGDDIDIILFDNKNKKIDKGSLSMGERQMYASALLHSLVDESDISFPVFIDSPMQKFDEEHARNIIKYFYPTVSKQVVIFPLINKELTEAEFNQLLPKINKTYLINNLTTTTSEFVVSEPKSFLETYNQIYNAN